MRGVFYIDDPIADPLAHGKSEFVEPAAEGAVFVKDALEFRGDDGDAFCGVGYEAEMDGSPRAALAPVCMLLLMSMQ